MTTDPTILNRYREFGERAGIEIPEHYWWEKSAWLHFRLVVEWWRDNRPLKPQESPLDSPGAANDMLLRMDLDRTILDADDSALLDAANAILDRMETTNDPN